MTLPEKRATAPQQLLQHAKRHAKDSQSHINKTQRNMRTWINKWGERRASMKGARQSERQNWTMAGNGG